MALRHAFAAFIACAAFAAWGAPPEYPARAVRLIVADAPRSTADIIARALAKEMGRSWKKPVIVENRPGAGGRVAAQAVARAKPDGYTLLYAPNGAFTVEPWTHPSKGFDALRDLEPVAVVANAPFFLAVPRAMSVNSAQELIGNARLRAGAMRYGTPSDASMQQFAALSIAQRAGVRWQHVTVATGAQAAKDLAEGKVQVFVDTYPVVQPITDREKAKILAVTTDQRFPALPDVASIGDVVGGWSEMSILHGLFVPRGTPDAVIGKINAEANRAVQARLLLKAMFMRGFVPGTSTPAQLRERLAREHEEIGRLATSHGLSPR